MLDAFSRTNLPNAPALERDSRDGARDRRWIWLLPVSAALVMHLGGRYDAFPVAQGVGAPPAAWWWVSVGVAVASAIATFRLMRALGVEGALVPLAMTIGSTGVVGALAVRAADGPSGAGFGMEPLALCLLLWCYDAVVRNHPVRAGVLLGAASLAHPIMLAHGLFAVVVATAFTAEGRWRRLGLTAAVALAAGAPAVIHLGMAIGDVVGMDAAAAARVVNDGYLFRYPNAYTLRGLLWEQGTGRVLLALAGLAGAMSLLRSGQPATARALAGLISAHVALTALAVLCYTGWVPGPWNESVTAYALDLTLTSPLLPILSGIALMAAIESHVTRAPDGIADPPLLRFPLWAAAATLLAMTDWSQRDLLAAALGVVALAALKTGRAQRLATAVLGAAAIAAVVAFVGRERPRPPLERADAELYEWARSTHKRAAFIVPPTARAFRYYTRRGVYVDYDLIPPASPGAMLRWRERLDRVARPDPRIATVPAWQRPYVMDRSFAVANTPARAAELLAALRADYLVWDVRGLATSPHRPDDRPPAPGVTEAFRNDRYVVYAAAAPQR
jgi:hypothetical protein